jgi:release factor glutamine methyltransferase
MMRLRLPSLAAHGSWAALPVASECCPDVEACLNGGALVLEQAGIETARLDAECLLADVLAVDRWELLCAPHRRLVPAEFSRYLRMLQRREQREPLAYVLGRREFWSLSLTVGPGVLIPRPDTETLVEAALALWRGEEEAAQGAAGVPGRPRVVELCTGSGAVAIALARELPTASLVATDLAWRALRVARANALAHGVADRIRWCRGDLWRAIDGEAPAGSADLVIANPPYIPSTQLDGLMPEVHWEPRLALDGGSDGLEVVRAIVRTTPDRLRPGGCLLLEIGADQADRVRELLSATGRFGPARVFSDLAGRPRVVAASRNRQ